MSRALTRTSLILLGLAATGLAHAGEATLTYQGTNQWVAEADNAPLRQILKAAKGREAFTITLPKTNRALSVQRLTILTQLMEKQRNGQPVTLTETGGSTAANTIKVKW